MKNNIFLIVVVLVAGVALATTHLMLSLLTKSPSSQGATTIAVKEVGENIVASGTIHSTQEATLHFQTGGKVTYLPLQPGDAVAAGTTIAQLDTYTLQQQLTQALNNYQSTRDTFDQTQANAQSGVLQGSQKNALNLYNQSAVGGADTQNTAINDAVKRIVDQNQANLNNSVSNVQLANYALQLATLSSPFSGVLVSEDITTANQNVTTTTSFVVADPTQLVFKANVAAQDIDFVTVGAQTTIQLTGSNAKITGVVSKIYPQKTTLPDGEDIYVVDITAQPLSSIAKLGQTGTVSITSNAHVATILVPTWTIVGHTAVWVMEQNKAMLKKVTIGKVHDNLTEVTNGLAPSDMVITNPQTIAGETYNAL